MDQNYCKHWIGIRPLLSSGDGRCGAGIDMFSVSTAPKKETSIGTLPCVKDRCPEAKCDRREFPTEEEAREYRKEMKKLLAKSLSETNTARAAVVGKIGKWVKGSPTAGVSGKIDCPVCGGKNTLAYSRASINGHIHASCATENCVRWME